MIEPPKPLNIGPKWLREKINEVINYIRVSRPISGIGVKFIDGPDGRIAIGDPSGQGGYSGPRLHVLSLGDFTPDPFKITADVIQTLTESIDELLPDSGDIADLITSAITAAASSGTSPSSVVASVQALFVPALSTLGTVSAMVDDIVQDIVPISSALEAHFNAEGAAKPRNGDRIYTESLGIIYELWKQKDGIPSGNTIFRVPFSVGGVTWVAMTLTPAPDIGALVEEVAGMALNLLQNLIASTTDAVLQAVADGLIELYNDIQDILEEILAIWEAIAGIEGADLTEILSRLYALENGPVVRLVDTAGNDAEVRVIQYSDKGSMLQTRSWIDSNGVGHQADWIFYSESSPHIEDVDWRDANWIGQKGEKFQAPILTYISPVENPREEAVEGAMELETITVCSDEDEPEERQVLMTPSEE